MRGAGGQRESRLLVTQKNRGLTSLDVCHLLVSSDVAEPIWCRYFLIEYCADLLSERFVIAISNLDFVKAAVCGMLLEPCREAVSMEAICHHENDVDESFQVICNFWWLARVLKRQR